MAAEGITKCVSTIYNGIKRPDVSNIQEADIFNRYDKVVLSIARTDPPKQPQLFVDIARQMPKYGFVWIGNQHDMTEFGELPANCHFLGNIVNAGAYCSKADLFMLPSNYE
jgi:glycosyltransferase involved in cell wall biosynthesis